ncbi:efflux RND transporter periplasmic adaptor subunit [Rhodoblastus acidophilus]|uniref:Efflux RND transporter periplasmic adaptor subunit n=1 Tax=Candidatus Rhodoblastus alkanivorans TaxID=2954117 RepID=A0ABS9Z8N7_9HYPH|nr:efflux RND transporter periplasmic adaptor subunit [Candidatus Rhodoblastus alkanivorans]MCI4679329.1 efflux RND transporter periplasmic adaptor subunit [Candidatus Rhodoblastus alkanivorans]MCI4684044.1 efflux RND transporter periplasmic adaptor subunit [Candidatus Rhodoblastus alkanivorans]MDI4641364.1 efflux RND transporter periplasmic adaptor subunit [Rhodoblastus acidophilus]
MRKRSPFFPIVQGLAAVAVCAALSGAAQAGEFVVKKRNVPDMKAMFGQVESRDIVPARTRIGGVLASRSVDEGAHVKAGDVIATVADEKLALQAQSLDGQLKALQSQLANATDALKRAQDLLPRGFITKAAYDQAKTNVDVLQHQVEAMQSQRAVVSQQMSEGNVLAPRDGVVLTVSVIPGSVVLPGETIARIAAGNLFLRLSLPERHAALLKLGSPVLLTARGQDAGLELGSGAARKGSIVKIYPEIENGRVIADAEVADLSKYFVGERVQIYAPVGEREVMLIPRSAIMTRSGVDYVRVLRAEGPLDVAVVYADSAEPGMVEVLTGLQSGDKVQLP